MVTETRSRDELKAYFVKNSIPTENNFSELIDGMLNLNDDGIVKLPGNPLRIEAVGDETSFKKVFHFYRNSGESKPDWVFNLNPRSDPTDPSTAQLGFNISDGDGNNRLFIDHNTGNVGIGTISPTQKLEVNGTIKATQGLRVDEATNHLDADGAFYRYNNEVYITVDNNLYVRDLRGDIAVHFNTDSGRLGINKLNPAYTLDVNGTMHANKYVVQNGIDGGSTKGILMWADKDSRWGIYMSRAGSGKSLADGNAIGGYGFSSHALRFRTYNSIHNGLIYENGSEELNFSVRASDGLTYVRGNLKAKGVNVSDSVANHIDADGAFYRYDGQVYINVDDNLYIRDSSGGIAAHFDTNNGRLSINKASPTEALDVNGAIKIGSYGISPINSSNFSHRLPPSLPPIKISYGILHYGNRGKVGEATVFNPDGNIHGLWLEAGGGSNGGGIFMNGNIMCLWSPANRSGDIVRVYDEDDFDNNPTPKIRLNRGGVVSSSDQRIKQDIEDLKYGLEDIKKLRPVSFNWKTKPKQHKNLGLIGQEVEAVINEVVYADQQDATEPMLGIAYTSLIPVLINAIKELDTKIEHVANQRQ